ncbi:MAG: beta-lactamase family protein [bacterium]|nr:beta-lactamase family protein [bacterium]
MLHRLIILAAVLLATTSAAAQDLAADLQSVIDRFHAANPSAPGVVVHVECPPHGLDRTFVAGVTDRGVDEALTAHHTFRIASNTKTYVAAAILRLGEMGLLNIDDPLALHLSEEQRILLSSDGYDLQAMTVGQVLSHTSGLFEHPADPRYAEAILANPQREWTADELIRLCVEWGDPVGAPGEKFSYSDTGYIILGGIVERKTGRNLGQAVHSLLDYDDLGLDSTWWEIYEDEPATAAPRAHQYYGEHDATGWHPSMDLYGGGGLLTDARDLGRFLRLLLGGEVFQHEATLAAMTGQGAREYRLGIFCTRFDDRLAWGHTGFWNTFAFHVPAQDLTVSGAVLDHFTERGQVLAEELVAIVAAARVP